MFQPEYWFDPLEEGKWLPNPFRAEPAPFETRVRGYFETAERQLEKGLFELTGARADGGRLRRMLARIDLLNGAPVYGLIVNRADLKLFPRLAPLVDGARQADLDRNQLSGLEPGESCRIFGFSPDGNWCAVVSDRGTGWVDRRLVALAGREEINYRTTQLPWLTTLDQVQRLKVTWKDWLTVGMGNRFPAVDPFRRQVLIPARNRHAELVWHEAELQGGVSTGPLNPTFPNVLRQFFKYLGYQYAWGDRDRWGAGIDCSRFIQNVYQTVGWSPPRNSREQLAAGIKRYDLGGLDPAERLEVIRRFPPGSLLFTDSHVMVLLGVRAEKIYVIHAFYMYRRPDGNGERRIGVKRVVLSDLSPGCGTATGSLYQRLTDAVLI